MPEWLVQVDGNPSDLRTLRTRRGVGGARRPSRGRPTCSAPGIPRIPQCGIGELYQGRTSQRQDGQIGAVKAVDRRWVGQPTGR
jgi:hypothetical protein